MFIFTFLYSCLRFCLHTFIWYQVFLFNTNNLCIVVQFQVFSILIISKQIYLTHSWDPSCMQICNCKLTTMNEKWLNYFNAISNCLGSFYTSRLGNWVHYSFIFTFFVQLFLKRFYFCTWPYPILIIFKQIYLTHRWDPDRYNNSRLE